MGKIVEKKRKKKKGRPSLLDLQKRSLKQQKQLLKKHNKNLLFSKNNNIFINDKNGTHHKLPPPPPSPARRNPSGTPNSISAAVRRSTRRNPNPNFDEGRKKGKKVRVVIKADEGDDDDDDDDDDGGGGVEDGGVEGGDGEERENSGCDDFTPGEFEGRSLRKRKIDSISGGSGELAVIDDELQDEKPTNAETNPTNIEQASNTQDDGPVTPLPDKKLLLFILERLQKKDTYGVFAEPVDPEELPDYHEIIEHPMDFSTVRKKLEDGAYGNLEEFEKDIFLICSNAMQYNAPDTIYFRQACSIQELASKNFDNLRQDSDDNNELDPEPKVVRRGRPPKYSKRPPGRPPLVRANSDFSEKVLATAGGTTNRSNNDPKKGSSLPEKHGSTESFTRTLLGSHNSEAYLGRSAERFDRSDDMIGSSSKGFSMKHGKRVIVLDENRRNTYKDSYASSSRHEPSVLTTFHGARKQLISVGLHTEYGYARSLARFAAKLGPVAWKVASRKIERCLPSTVKFGPGWVGENEAPSEKPLQRLPNASFQSSAPVTTSASVNAGSCSAPTQGVVDSGGDVSKQKPQREQLSEIHMTTVPAKLNDLNKSVSTAKAEPSNDTGTNTIAPETSASFSQSSTVHMVSTSIGPISSVNSIQIHQVPPIKSRVNGVNGSYGLKKFAPQTGKIIGSPRPSMIDVTVSKTEPQSSNGFGEAKLAANSSTIKASDGTSNGLLQKKGGSAPPDLNVGFHSPRSPGSGKVDSVQTDLALQL